MNKKAPQNRSLTLEKSELRSLSEDIQKITKSISVKEITNSIINHDLFEVVEYLPSNFVDLMFIDPPYNLTKSYNGNIFKKMSSEDYKTWVESWVKATKRLLKPDASIYICGDWRTSSIIDMVCRDEFHVINRITVEREKGRGSKKFWKNNSEDIWFFANSDNYYFNADAVKIKRKVIAPYRVDGKPKDWEECGSEKYRLTYSSNIWTDITIPFWSMPENTPHPTQKPEKLLAKIVLASSKEGDIIFDPFAGVGTTAVVAKKLNRKYVTVEIDEEYCLYTAKRLKIAKKNKEIQGYKDGCFWERNSLNSSTK